MNKTNFAMFLAGATVGAAAAWFGLKKRYEQIAQEEIDSVKAVYSAKKEPVSVDARHDELQEENQHKADIAKLKPDLVKYAAKLQEEAYINYTEHSKKNIEEMNEESMTDAPYVISPDEFSTFDDYTTISLVYYNGDDVLADEENELIEDLANTVGEDFASHFGEYEDDSVFVRNDRLKCDYEILRDNRSYSDVTGNSPY